MRSADVFRKEGMFAREGIAAGSSFREIFALPQGYKNADHTKSELYFPLKIEIDGFEAFFLGTAVAASRPAFKERNFKYRKILASHFVAVPLITQPLGPESQVTNIYMRTLRLRENYMGHYKNANPDIEIDARVPPLQIHVEKQAVDFLLQVTYYLSPLFIPPELFHHYLVPSVKEDNDHDISRLSLDLSSIKLTYSIQNGDSLEVSVRKTSAFVNSKRGHKELMMVAGTSAGQTAVGLSITHIVRIESVQCNFVSVSSPRTSHEVINWNVSSDDGVPNSGIHVQPERFAVDYCLRMFCLQNGSLIDLAYVVTLGDDQTKPTKPTLELQPIFVTLSASLVKFLFLAASEIQTIFILDAINALQQNSGVFEEELLRQICDQQDFKYIDALSFRYKSDWLKHVRDVRVEHDAHCTMTSLSSIDQELQVLGADDLAHRCLKDQTFAAIFGDLCSKTKDSVALKNLCGLFQSADFHHHKSAEIAIFHFCSQNHKNAELLEFVFQSYPSGLERYLEMKQQFVGNYAVTAHAKLQCHRIRVALVDDALTSLTSHQRSTPVQFSSCDIKGISVRIKRLVDDRGPPPSILSRASSPSSSRLMAGSPVLSPAHFSQPILHQAVCEIDSFDFDAFVRNAASVSAQIKSAREEAHGIRFQADQLQLCTRSPVAIGKLAASIQTLNTSVSLQDFATAFDPFVRMMQSFAYAGSTPEQSISIDDTILNSSVEGSDPFTEGDVFQSQTRVAKSVGQFFQTFENADIKFDGIILDFEVVCLPEEVALKMMIQIHPLLLDSRSFSCHGIRLGIGRKQAEATLLHIFPSNSDQLGLLGSGSLHALQHAIRVECGMSSLCLELSDVFIGNEAYGAFDDLKNFWITLSRIPEAVAASIASAEENMQIHEHSALNDPAACLRVKFSPFFIYNEAFAHPLLFASTSVLQKRVAARVFGNSAMVSPITGNVSPAAHVQDASVQILDPLSLRFFGDVTPTVKAEDRHLFGSPTADATRLSYSADEVSRICASAGNSSAVPLFGAVDQESDAPAPLISSIRLSLGLVTVTVPGHDKMSTSCSLGARFDLQSSADAPCQFKVDASLESLRIYRARSRSNEHEIVRGVALRLEVSPETASAGTITPPSRITVTLQRGVKVCLGTNPLSSLNHFASDVEEIAKLFKRPSLSPPLSLNNLKSDSCPSSPEPRSLLISGLLELDAPPPIFGSPVRVITNFAHQQSPDFDGTARSLLFGKELEKEEDPDAYAVFMHSDIAARLAAFFRNSQLDVSLVGGGNGESVVEIELISGSMVSRNDNVRPLGHGAVGVVRMHLVAHCPGGEPFIRLSPSPLPWHAVNFSLNLPAPSLSVFGYISNFAVRLDCASSPGISSLCPVTLFQLAVYCVPRGVSTAHVDASSVGSLPKISAALHIGAVSVDTSSSMALWSASTAVIESVSLGCNESTHNRRTLKVINKTGSSLYFFDPDRQRIDAGCFKLFMDLETSSVVPFYIADVAHSSFDPPLMLLQAERYYSLVRCENGFAYAAVVDVVIDAAEARVTCTISSCISVTNLLPRHLCLIALSDDCTTRFICEIPSCTFSDGSNPHFLPLHELRLPVIGIAKRPERIVLVPSCIWLHHLQNGGSSSMLEGCQFTAAFESVEENNCDVMCMYDSSMALEFGHDSASVKSHGSSCTRWSSGNDEVFAHVSVDVRQQVHSHNSFQSVPFSRHYLPPGCDLQLTHIIHIDVIVQPEVIIVNSLPHTMHVCLHPADTSGDATDGESSPPIFAGIVPSGSSVSVNTHLWQSMRVSLRAGTFEGAVADSRDTPSEICHIMFGDRHVSRCPVLVSDCSSVFPRFCDVRVESTVQNGSQLQIALMSPGVVRNGTSLPLFVQFFSSADATSATSGECFVPPRPVACNTSSAVLKWWNCSGGLRDLLTDCNGQSNAARDGKSDNACSQMYSPFHDKSALSSCTGIAEVAMQVDAFVSIKLFGGSSAKGEGVRDVRSGEVFSFDVGGIIHDVVIELKAVRGPRGETVQHVSILPLLVVTNRRCVRRSFLSTLLFSYSFQQHHRHRHHPSQSAF